MGGHSFGGYTTLAIAGATIDFNYLQEACESFGGALNVSLLLECRALELPREDYQFRDTRVQAILAGNPVNRFIFGEKGISKIDIPVILGSGSNDPAAPAAIEQAIPFTWLVVSSKYWMLIEGQAHVNFSKLDGGIKQALDSTIHLTLPSQDLISSYVNGVALAFFEYHINKNEDYLPYLNSSYAEYLSQNQKFKLNLITGNSSEKLQQAIEDFRNRNR
jgi:predicted dienelactone hydrolase